jgi:NAD+ diphosphatase
MRADELVTMGRTIVDRAGEHRTDQAWLDAAWGRARVLLVSDESTTPVFQDGATVRLALAGPDDVAAGADRWFLGVADEVPYFAVLSDAHPDWLNIRQLGVAGDPLELDLLVTSVGLTQWHLRHDHCARCGAKTEIQQAGWTRRCPVDNSDHFPRTDPAVIMLVHDGGDRCLLGRGAIWPPGRYSTLAGFVEPGESLESAVIREVFEEAGVVIDDVRYVASQPWPFPSSLMLGFTAHADGASVVRPDKIEMAEAGWFTREQVRQAADWTDADQHPGDGEGVLYAIPPKLSISRFLIDSWLEGLVP